jgi:hypothetical protein
MMSTKERCQQEARLAELFGSQREATERKDREGADALFRQIWDVLDPPEAQGST